MLRGLHTEVGLSDKELKHTSFSLCTSWGRALLKYPTNLVNYSFQFLREANNYYKHKYVFIKTNPFNSIFSHFSI